MEPLEERILHYPDLPPEQQEAVAARASDDPEHAALLEHVRALERLFEQARALSSLSAAAAAATGEHAPSPGEDDSSMDEALAFFLTTPREALPPALQDDFDRVAAALEEADETSALRKRRAAVAKRLRALEEQSADAPDHFASLTGHDVSPSNGYARPDDTRPDDTRPDDADAPGRVEEPTRAAQTSTTTARARKREADRTAERRTPGTPRLWPPAAWPKAARYAGAAALAVLVLYGGLRAAGRLSQSKMERLASMEEERLRVEGYPGGSESLRLRGGAASESSSESSSPADSSRLDQRYLRALRSLRAARTTTLGLFPRYDAEALRRAEGRLEAVVEEAQAGSFLHLEALFFLGKARLAQGDKAGATRALRRVAGGGGRLTPEAQDLLNALYEDAAYDGPPSE
jgi:hypothetical protein